MPSFAYERLRAGSSFPGVLAIHQLAALAACLDDIELVIATMDAGELANQVWFLPFAS